MDECSQQKADPFSAPEDDKDEQVDEACEGEAEEFHYQIDILEFLQLKSAVGICSVCLGEWGNERLGYFQFVDE